jgi:hypothetical protein
MQQLPNIFNIALNIAARLTNIVKYEQNEKYTVFCVREALFSK